MSRLRAGIVVFAALLSALLGSFAPAQNANEAKLKKIREQILSVQKKLDAQANERDSLAVQLRDTEITVAAARRKLADLRRQRAISQERQVRLQAQRHGVERELDDERQALADELRAAHAIGVHGGQEQLKLLFNQQNPALIGRMLTYYGYFGRSRAARIASIRTQLDELASLDRQLTDTNEALAQLSAKSQAELQALTQARTRRAGVIRDLERQIKNRQTQLAKLKEQEGTLEKLLRELRRATAGFPVSGKTPFEKVKGRLSWPVTGKVVANFGQPRSAGLTWNGVLLQTERGSQVRAVYFGRVIYADWLTGMGLLTIIEHSGGYLSLYGHNEQLFKAVGDWVEPGDVIAAAGDSGGRARPELYFEIRKGAKPLNPRQWMKKR